MSGRTALLILFLSASSYAATPPYKTSDSATDQDFKTAYDALALHIHDNNGSSRLHDTIPGADSLYDLGKVGIEWANLYVDSITASFAQINQTASTMSFRVQDGGVTVLEVIDGGNVNIPKMSLSRGYVSGNVSNGIGTAATLVPFDSETYDLLSELSGSTYTVVAAGYYSIKGQVETSGLGAADKKLFVYIYKNGAEVSKKTCVSGGTAELACTANDTFQLSAGDFINIYTRTSAAAAKDINGGSASTFFVVEKIR